MASFTLEEAPVYEPIPAGTILSAEVTNCEKREGFFWVDQNDHSKGKQEEVSFTFKITEPGDYEGRVVFGNTPPWFTNHPNCKLRIWAQEILGIDTFPIGFEFDTDDLIGLPVKVTMDTRVSKKKNADGSDKITGFVGDVQRAGDMDFADDIF